MTQPRSRLRPALAAVLSLLIAAPSGGFAAPLQDRAFDPDKPADGVVSEAACRPYGFTPARGREEIAVTGTRAYAAPAPGMAAPAPVVTHGPIQAPPPPPPPPPPPSPPPPSRPVVVDYLATIPAQSNSLVPEQAPAERTSPLPPERGDTSRYPDATPNPVQRTASHPVSTFSIDVDTASYTNVRRMIEQGRRPPADAVRVEEMVNYFDYGYARPRQASEPFIINTEVIASPWAEGRRIVRVGLQGYELPEGQRRPLNLTFLVDVSGSMDSPDKLELAKKAMNLVIDQLRPEDTLSITYYASREGTTIAPTPGDHKLKLRCAVASLSASGATAGARGMVNAYEQAEANFSRDRVNRILMFTDGDFNVGVTDNQRLEDYVAGKRRTGIYLSLYGFGQGNYQDERMQAVAQAGNGTAAYIDDLDEARRLFGPMFHRGAFPIADDVKIQVEFNPEHVAEWRLIGYETRLLNEQDFANDAIDAGEVGSGASVTALYEITPVGGPTVIPERQFEGNRAPARTRPRGDVAVVQVRYKQPGEATSRLISTRIGPNVSSRPSEATRWAVAVAGFAQLLRGDPWLAPGYGWDQVLEMAQGARGQDPWGDRAEFTRLVRAASALPERRAP